MNTTEETIQKLHGLREYLKINFGQPLTQDKIDQCNQFITELEAEIKSVKNSSRLSPQNLV